jgi:hypothetical protein
VPNTYCSRGENDERPCVARRHSRCQVGEEQGGDVRSSSDSGKLLQEDHRRLDGTADLQACAAVGVVAGNRLLIVLAGFRCAGTPGSWHGGVSLWVYYCRYCG